MTNREKLTRMGELELRISGRRTQLEKLRELGTGNTAGAVERVCAELEALLAQKQETEDLLASLPEQQRRVLELLYGRGLSAAEAAEKTGLCRRQIYRIRDRALRAVEP